jgi:secreted PhoX family phosphatase
VFNQGINSIAVSLHQAGPTSSDTQFDLTIGAPKVPNDTALGCNGPMDVHIGCFTSLEPASQTPDLIIPSTHRMQKIIEQGDDYTKNNPNIPWTTVPGNNDFTAYVGRNGSNIDGVVAINHENGTGGVSIVDVRYDSINRKWTIDTTQAVDFYNNDLVTTQRNCSGGISPWGTIMTCEETFSAGDNNSDGYQDVGWIVEIDPWTKKVMEYGNGKQEKLWAMGRMAHENVCFSDSSTAYFAEDGGTSCVYKFVSDNPADMTSGMLYVLVLDGPLLAGEPSSSTGSWVLVPNTSQADRNNTNSIAASLGGTNFSGPEDVEVGTLDGKIYFAAKGLGRTYRFTDNGSTVSGFETFVGGDSYLINHGTGVTNEPWGGGNDNLTFDDRGNLYVLQDGGRDHLWMVRPNHTQLNPEVELFMRTPSGSEPCGFQFTHDYRFGFLSIQHPSSSNSSTFQLDVNGDTLYFDRSTTVAIARREFLNENAIVIGMEQKWLAEEFELNVYPNPSSDVFNVKFNLEEGSDVRGEVRDLRGHTQRIMETQYFEKGENELRVQVSDLRAGLYILILEIEGKVVIQKLIVE